MSPNSLYIKVYSSFHYPKIPVKSEIDLRMVMKSTVLYIRVYMDSRYLEKKTKNSFIRTNMKIDCENIESIGK